MTPSSLKPEHTVTSLKPDTVVSSLKPAVAGTPASRSNPHSGYHWAECQLAEPVELGVPSKVRLIYHPGVYLVSYMTLDRTAVDEFLADHNITTWRPAQGTDHECLTELSGRLCYMSYEKPRPGGIEAFLNNLKGEAHGSVFEHPHYSFIVTGVSRNLTLEANRHRPVSISQLSGRFVDGESVGFVVDPEVSGEDLGRWVRQAARSMGEYRHRFDTNYEKLTTAWRDRNPEAMELPKKDERRIIKRAREKARDILPGCLETRVLYTMNARAVRFIMEKRCHRDAAWEIRRLFNSIYRRLKAHDPRLFSDYAEEPLDDGTFELTTPYPKV